MTDTSLKKQFFILLDAGFKQITELGSSTLTAVIALTILFFSQSLALRIILGIVGVTIISYLIKIFFFKQRPKKQSKDTFIEKVDASSFPSIHAARMTVIVFWLIAYFNNMYLTIFSLIIGMLVIYSRIYLKKHYWSDVIGGLVISLAVNGIIYFLILGSVL
jgi:membrane-associated phospholipid phosphatase